MKPCEQAQLIHAYHDGELPAERKAFVEAHLRECPACAEELATLRATTAKLRFAARPALSTAGLAKLHERVETQAKADAEAGALRLASWLTAAAAGIALACTAHLMLEPKTIEADVPAHPSRAAVSSAWETTAMLAMADARGGPASGEYKLQQLMIDDLSSGSGAEDNQ